MVGELITLPLRLTGKATRLWWRTTEQAIGLASEAAGFVTRRISPSDSRPREPRAPARTPDPSPKAEPVPSPSHVSSRPATTSTEQSPPVQPLPAPMTTEPPPTVPAEEPTHVSEEPELVEEFAEPGAEDGAGPELHIQEPWDGYRQMSAREVTARLPRASAAELAAVQLYESSNRGRETILAAVARQLSGASQLSTPGGSGSQP